MKRDLDHVVSAFRSADWILPAHIMFDVLADLAADICAAPTGEKHEVLESALPRIYDEEYSAIMLLARYSKVPFVAEFSAEIAEAIEAAQLGLFHPAVATLVPVLEGVLRKLADARGAPIGGGTRHLVREIEALIEHERTWPHRSEERIVMLKVFLDFVRDHFLTNTATYSGVGHLNRHGILHGVFSGYGHSYNYYRLISFLDMICFILVIQNGGFGSLPPTPTVASARLARYYRTLRQLAATRSSDLHGTEGTVSTERH